MPWITCSLVENVDLLTYHLNNEPWHHLHREEGEWMSVFVPFGKWSVWMFLTSALVSAKIYYFPYIVSKGDMLNMLFQPEWETNSQLFSTTLKFATVAERFAPTWLYLNEKGVKKKPQKSFLQMYHMCLLWSVVSWPEQIIWCFLWKRWWDNSVYSNHTGERSTELQSLCCQRGPPSLIPIKFNCWCASAKLWLIHVGQQCSVGLYFCLSHNRRISGAAAAHWSDGLDSNLLLTKKANDACRCLPCWCGPHHGPVYSTQQSTQRTGALGRGYSYSVAKQTFTTLWRFSFLAL